MTKTLKKSLALILTCVMLFSIPVMAFAKPTEWISQSLSDIPVIRISGDGEPLYDQEGNKIFHYKDILKLVSGENGTDNSEMYKSMATTLLPAIAKGLITDNWDDLYEGLETEISKIFANSLLDKNGNVTNGSGISETRKQEMANKRAYSQKGEKGFFAIDDYWFHYDWRLDPMETADVFHSFVQDIL